MDLIVTCISQSDPLSLRLGSGTTLAMTPGVLLRKYGKLIVRTAHVSILLTDPPSVRSLNSSQEFVKVQKVGLGPVIFIALLFSPSHLHRNVSAPSPR